MQDVVTILHLEDDPLDAELVQETIKQQGFIPNIIQVDTEEAFRREIKNPRVELILADYVLPQFDGVTALKIAHAERPDIPFIFVSGTIGEDLAIESLKSGAADYVLKQRMQRLGLAIHRALRDATDQKRINESNELVRKSEERYRLLFQCSPLPMWVFDRETLKILAVNAAAISHYGYSEEEFLSFTIDDIRPTEDAPRLLETIASGHSGLSSASSWRHRTKNGTIIDVEITRHTLDFTGRPAELVLAHDVTERKLALDQLRQTNEQLALMTQQLWQASKLATMGELAASIAHELNNPLAIISLRTEFLEQQLVDDDPKREEVAIIAREVERMATLVSNLLVFSRRSHPQISTVDLREELTNSLDLIHYHLRNHEINILKAFDADLPTVQADRQQLRQVFLNLMTNASDAMWNGGTLTVRALRGLLENGDEAVIIEFSDTGVGIEPENMPKLWDSFFTTKPEGKGTGLGLPICRRTVKEHRGTIEIESEVGVGTTVRIILPATGTGVEKEQ
ncbi:MAG TPA: ATP-binding protein [Pyrinomonadaceae bacterium]|jgi:PAS domain S-box-containing protein|nr:ATP-binding protein [Pyrinomonadaceae bacterium]